MSSTALTPYDTGKRGEPKIWSLVTPKAGFLELGPIARELEEDRFGKVDFDNEEGGTIATVWIEKNEHGQNIMHVQQLGDEVLVRVLS